MNEFLTNFSKTLDEQFDADPVPGNVANNYYNKPTLLNEYEITNIDIINIIKDIDQHKGSGIDFLPTFILLDAFASIPFVIAHLMNQSLLTGIFPEKWSVATVTPIPKGGDLHNVGNWRPISILPLPGKILEKICTSFLLNELTDNEIISEFQFGFCRGLSTSHAIFHVVKQIIEGINSRNVTVSLYLDFARAFDSVNYRLLLAKLHDMGISLMLIRWIKGYLSNRRMCTKMNGHTSTVLPLLSGVPQGSIVGPILFLCYINDIVKVAYDCEIQISLYADDAVLYCTNSDRNILLHRMQHALDSVSAWCIANRINLNTKKTKYCIYGSRNLMRQYDLALYFSDILLQRCKQYNYLGVLLDETMSIHSNYNHILKKFSHKIFLFSKIRNYLDVTTRVLVYKQTVLPLVKYVGFLLTLNRSIDIEKLQRLQNRALRLCFNINVPRDMPIIELHYLASLLPLCDRREIQLSNIMFDIRHDRRYVNCPLVQTRQADRVVFKTEIVHYEIYRRSPYYVGRNLWNNLPLELTSCESKIEFKNLLKKLYWAKE